MTRRGRNRPAPRPTGGGRPAGAGDVQPPRRRSRIGGVIAALAVAIVCAAVGVVAWTRYVPHAVISVSGEPLGRLPAGGSTPNPQPLLLTPDTTPARRLHAYGVGGIETPNPDPPARE